MTETTEKEKYMVTPRKIIGLYVATFLATAGIALATNSNIRTELVRKAKEYTTHPMNIERENYIPPFAMQGIFDCR